MTADALAIYIARPSAAMILTELSMFLPCLRVRFEQPVSSQYQEMM